MDIIETIDAVFDDLLPEIMKAHGDKKSLERLLSKTKHTILCISAANPMNTCYIMEGIQPTEYLQIAKN